MAERIYPPNMPELDIASSDRERGERRLGALGLARTKVIAASLMRLDAAEIGEEAVVDGVEGTWRLDAAALEHLDHFHPRTALLSPFDQLVSDRERLRDLFDYEYILEMYKPAAKRRWGYFALPILHGDRLVGKLDAKADHKAGVLRVAAVHEDVPFDARTASAVGAEIDALARWLGLERG